LIFTPTALADALVIDVAPHADERGFLARTFCEHEFARNGAPMRVVQCSTIYSRRRGTLRGLHFQIAPHAEAKLVRCTRGAAYVVIVDIRAGSTSYCDWIGVELSSANRRLLYVPEGFAQGYQTLEDDTEVFYQMSHEYAPNAASGVRWDDAAFGIEWPAAETRIISERDRAWPDLSVAIGSPVRR
jgi:dTDP-4-dehydrorhamnose 3,5-epimerase